MSRAVSEVSSHSHAFHAGNPLAERRTRHAVVLTAAMMAVEIAGGWYFNSMALLADGWHMSSHALALGLSALAYAAARRYAADGRFAFGTWKIEVLGGFASALCLAGVALLMTVESVLRLLRPAPIQYDQAMVIAAVGLLVNLACAWLLRDGHGHGHGHTHGHTHGNSHGHAAAAHHDAHGRPAAHAYPPPRDDAAHAPHRDLNLRSAYLHVIADAATSVLAILALAGGRLWGAAWLDPLMGIAGAVLVAVWARGLLRQTARALLDAEMDAPIVRQVREALSAGPTPAHITDLHVWRVGAGKYACIVSLSAPHGAAPADFKRLLARHGELAHVTIEVNPAG